MIIVHDGRYDSWHKLSHGHVVQSFDDSWEEEDLITLWDKEGMEDYLAYFFGFPILMPNY